MTVCITWLTIEQVIRIHETQIKTHGGSLGLRDRGSLESAVNRPRACHQLGGLTLVANNA